MTDPSEGSRRLSAARGLILVRLLGEELLLDLLEDTHHPAFCA